MDRNDIWNEILKERNLQDRQWGGPEHDDEHNSRDWIIFIVKQLGKASVPWSEGNFKIRMIKVAALAVAALEWLYR